MEKSTTNLTREEIGVILRRHRGSMAAIADSLYPPIRQTGVSLWLTGKTTSARIAEAAERKARELLDLEKQQQQATSGAGKKNVA